MTLKTYSWKSLKNSQNACKRVQSRGLSPARWWRHKGFRISHAPFTLYGIEKARQSDELIIEGLTVGWICANEAAPAVQACSHDVGSGNLQLWRGHGVVVSMRTEWMSCEERGISQWHCELVESTFEDWKCGFLRCHMESTGKIYYSHASPIRRLC